MEAVDIMLPMSENDICRSVDSSANPIFDGWTQSLCENSIKVF